MSIVALSRIALGATASDKSEAIKQAGQLLVGDSCVSAEYVQGMLDREATMSTYLGNGVAIPHGTHESIKHIASTGISVVQFPDGVVWEDEDDIAYLVIGIASSSDDHIEILSNLAEVLEEEEEVMALAKTSDKQLILDVLSGERESAS